MHQRTQKLKQLQKVSPPHRRKPHSNLSQLKLIPQKAKSQTHARTISQSQRKLGVKA